MLDQITREWLTDNLPTYICLLKSEFFQRKKIVGLKKIPVKRGCPHLWQLFYDNTPVVNTTGTWTAGVISKKYIEINKMAPKWATELPKCAQTCSQAAFLCRTLAKWWRSQRYRRWVPRPSGQHSPLCCCRSCQGWGTQKYRWHKGTWVVCRQRFRRTLHRSGPRSQCRRRTPSSLWYTCLWKAV